MAQQSRLSRCYDISDLRLEAKKRLPRPIFNYLDGGADDEWTLNRNSAAFGEYQLVPNCLVDVSNVDTSTTLFGQKLEWPVAMAPTGMSRLFHHTGEESVARSAAKAGTLYSLSALSTRSIEDVAGYSDGPKCFQLYVMKDRGLLEEFIDRARAANYAALMLTVDVPVPGNRQRDLVNGMTLPPRIGLRTVLDAAMHPAWSLNYLFRPKHELANVSHKIEEGSKEVSSVIQYLTNQIDRKLDWDDAAWMIDRWQGPFAIKGIQCVEDAKRAAEVGASSVIISNHGGRQLDFVPATIDLVAEIADAVGDRVEVVMDGGIRRGTDVIKVLACGARACMIGRSYLYGLSAGGEAGVDRSLEILRSEVERDMALLGCTTVDQIGRSNLRRNGK